MTLRHEASGAEQYYFYLPLLLLLIVPVAYYVAVRSADPTDPIVKGTVLAQPKCECSACAATRSENESLLQKLTSAERPHGVRDPAQEATLWGKISQTFLSGFNVPTTLLGYLFLSLVYVVYKIFTVGTIVEIFDPHTVLGIPESATKSEIRKAYRALSLTEHPDKVASHLRKVAEGKFVTISKAYKVLTDATARANFEKYGNPDGPQATSFGIALPAWLSNPAIVAVLYIALLGLGGWAVYRYFTYGTVFGDTAKARTLENGLQREPVEKLAKSFSQGNMQSPCLTADQALGMVAGIVRAHHPALALENKDAQALTKAMDGAKAPTSSNPAAAALLAHMHRTVALPKDVLETALRAAETALALAVRRGRYGDVPACLALYRGIAAAVPPTAGSPLLHLPHVTRAAITKLGGNAVTPLGLVKNGRPAFDKAMNGVTGLTATQREEMWAAALRAPIVQINGCSFGDVSVNQTPGNETQVHAESSEIACTVKLTFATAEDVAAGRVGAANAASDSPSKKGGKKDAAAAPATTTATTAELTLPSAGAHTPYFPQPQRAGVWLFVTESSRGGKLAPILNAAFLPFDDPAVLGARNAQTGEVTVRVRIVGPRQVGVLSVGINAFVIPSSHIEESRSFKLRLDRWSKKQRLAAGVDDEARKGADTVGRYSVVEVVVPKEQKQQAAAAAGQAQSGEGEAEEEVTNDDE
ncbi:hypothetical protein BC828DRAFT_384756 [Blastocladiella britannica]|nr:hypothetical protein BC828DRAFT_384756 [Blastocladiella britannica]